jgi:glyoxylase-like metal-dependent hydrolase (beta-lactamase superfamily II)
MRREMEPDMNLKAMPLVALFAVLTAASSLAMAQAPAHPPAAPVVKEGTTVKVSEHVYLIPDEKVAMVPNVGIIVGSRATLVVDPGMGVRSGQVVLREVQKVAKGGELYIVNTHFHPEHTTGEIAFPPSAKIIRAAAQQQDIDEIGVKWVENFRSRSPVIADVLAGFTAFRTPAEIFEREKILDLGNVRVRIMRLGPGHTRGDTVAFVEDDRVLFSGDLAMKQLFPAFATPQSSGRTWLTSLDELEKLKPRTVIGAHFPVADASVINDYRGYLKALQARVAELRKQGKSSDETAEQVRGEFAAKYREWAQPIRIHPAATFLYKESGG